MTLSESGSKALKNLRQKYPQYSDIDDSTLVSRITEKYPQYKDIFTFADAPKQTAQIESLQSDYRPDLTKPAIGAQPVQSTYDPVSKLGRAVGMDTRGLDMPTEEKEGDPPKQPIDQSVRPLTDIIERAGRRFFEALNPFRRVASVEPKPELKSFEMSEITVEGQAPMRLDSSPAAVSARQKLYEAMHARGEFKKERPIRAGYERSFNPEEASDLYIVPRVAKDIAAGAAGTLSGVSSAGEWAGLPLEDVTANLEKWRKALAPKNPNFIDDTLMGLGSMAVFMPVGVGAGMGAAAMFSKIPRLANIVGGTVAGVVEAGAEAGAVRREILERGGDTAYADDAARRTFLWNAAIIPAMNRIGVYGDRLAGAKKALMSAPNEMVQEMFQQIVSNIETGRPITEDVLKSGAIGAIIGAGAGFVVPGSSARQTAQEQTEDNSWIAEATKDLPPLYADRLTERETDVGLSDTGQEDRNTPIRQFIGQEAKKQREKPSVPETVSRKPMTDEEAIAALREIRRGDGTRAYPDEQIVRMTSAQRKALAEGRTPEGTLSKVPAKVVEPQESITVPPQSSVNAPQSVGLEADRVEIPPAGETPQKSNLSESQVAAPDISGGEQVSQPAKQPEAKGGEGGKKGEVGEKQDLGGVAPAPSPVRPKRVVKQNRGGFEGRFEKAEELGFPILSRFGRASITPDWIRDPKTGKVRPTGEFQSIDPYFLNMKGKPRPNELALGEIRYNNFDATRADLEAEGIRYETVSEFLQALDQEVRAYNKMVDAIERMSDLSEEQANELDRQISNSDPQLAEALNRSSERNDDIQDEEEATRTEALEAEGFAAIEAEDLAEIERVLNELDRIDAEIREQELQAEREAIESENKTFQFKKGEPREPQIQSRINELKDELNRLEQSEQAGLFGEEAKDVSAEKKNVADEIAALNKLLPEARAEDERIRLSKKNLQGAMFDAEEMGSKQKEMFDVEGKAKAQEAARKAEELEAGEEGQVESSPRDVPPTPKEGGDVLRQLKEEHTESRGTSITQAITSITDALSPEHRGKVVVVESRDSIPLEIRGNVSPDDRQTKAEYSKGTVYVLSYNIATAEQAQRAVLHELAGHYNLRQMFGGELNGFLDSLWDSRQVAIRNSPWYNRYTQKDKGTGEYKYPEYNPNTSRGRRNLAEEYIAHLAEDQDRTTWEKLIAWVRAQLRRIAPNLEWTDADLKKLIADGYERMQRTPEKSADAVRNQSIPLFGGEVEPLFSLGGQKFVAVAIKIGDKIYRGERGQIHADLLEKMTADEQFQYLTTADANRRLDGFIDDSGQFVSRQEASKIAKRELVSSDVMRQIENAGVGEENPFLNVGGVLEKVVSGVENIPASERAQVVARKIQNIPGFTETTEADRQRIRNLAEYKYGLKLQFTEPSLPPDIQRGGTSATADMGGYSSRLRQAIAMPELVEIAKAINEGKYPSIRERLGKKLGVFRQKGLEGDITLKADIFLGEEVKRESAKTIDLAKERIDDFAMEVMDEFGIPKDDVVVRIERDKNRGGYVLHAYKKDPTLATKVLAHEIGHLVDWLPEKDLRRGNILGRIATLKRYMETLIPASPSQGKPLLTNNERKQLRLQAAREMRGTPKDQKSKAIAARYKELLQQELARRELISQPEIMAELKQLTQIWKPFDDSRDANYTKYRYSSKELYADAISVLMNEPELFRRIAPKFSTSFFEYLNRKPEVKAVYDEIQELIGNPEALQDKRLEEVYDMWKRGDIARTELNKRLSNRGISGVKDNVLHWLVDKNQEALTIIRKQEKAGIELGRNARFALEEMENISTRVQDYLIGLKVKVLNPIRDLGLSEKDVDTMMFAKRIIEERSEYANPLGHTKETARELLQTLRGRLGEEKYAALEKILADYRQIRESEVYPEVYESGLFSDDTMDMVMGRKAYGKFSVTKWFDQKVGAGQGVKIYRQIGTLSEIESPFIATIMQDMSLLRAAKINKSKAELVAALRQAGAVQEAEMRWSKDLGGMKALEPRDDRLGLLTFMVGGKPNHVYVSRPIAEMFERAPFEATKVVEIWGKATGVIRQILVSKNPVWMVRNVVRDIRGTIKNNPEVRLRDVPELINFYRRTLPEVWRDVMHGDRSRDISDAAKLMATVADRNYDARDRDYNTELERIAAEFQLDPFEMREAEGMKGKVRAAWQYLDKIGRVSEQWGKIAGFKYLKAKANLGERELAHRVRTRIGTPDVRRRGSLQVLTNNIFMFSNVNKEGIRASIEAFNEDRAAYVWKTIATNMLPKLVLLGAATQVPWLEELLKGISDYDKRYYTIIPIGMNESGKSIYLRIPEDYEGQIYGALVWDLVHGKFRQLVEDADNANPYKWNPLIQIGSDLYSYYVKGLNPVDDWSGAPVIPRLAYETGGLEATKAMLKHASNRLGGNVIYNFKYDELVRTVDPVEEMLKTFPLTVVGTFVKISDRGHREALDRAAEEARKEKASKSQDISTAIRESINRMQGDYDPSEVRNLYNTMTQEGLLDRDRETFNEFAKRYRRIQLRVQRDPRVDVLLRAQSNDEKRAVLDIIHKENPGEFADFLRSAVEMRIVSRELAKEYGVAVQKPTRSGSKEPMLVQ